MSIDIDIIPASKRFFNWGELKSKLVSESLLIYNKSEFNLVDRDIEFFDLKAKESVAESSPIEPSGLYSVRLSNGTAIGISCHKNSDIYRDVYEYVKDFGRNLNNEAQLNISRIWSDVGYSFIVRKGSTNEGYILFIVIARALTKLTSGFVIISEQNTMLDLPIGIYAYDQLPT